MYFRIIASLFLVLNLMAIANAATPTYVVGSGGTYRPFEYENSQKELEGFDIDIIKAIAEVEQFNIQLINTPWEGIFATLDNGERDIIISGITITDKRKISVDFTLPYFPAEQVIVTQKSSPISNIQDLKGYSVGVVNGSTADVVVSKILGRNSTAIKRFDNTPLLLQELYEEGINAAVGDVGVIKFYIKMHPGKDFDLVYDNNFEQQYFGIAVAKGNQELQDKLNDGLKKIIANGTYANIYTTWFDNNVPVLPFEQ
ncbi:amino acid ABC transporter substrate-binding protein (PAAT family) [Orbus hercynius]|uniref:Amino acid ABC transporter substrate-binding protein (PAAT family) n=1 Tax=Orbus hercynius TaxID=593135 RepID=A0A495RHW2_9GAMM|nr:basic amino acid ABC transporter substrate-binding protein [Orbus hercynius]RKS87107.1 amino acid ABC transporter substrate-binding protein (PAAT family) [Orbus hercynius]